jgi:hypothetical protein
MSPRRPADRTHSLTIETSGTRNSARNHIQLLWVAPTAQSVIVSTAAASPRIQRETQLSIAGIRASVNMTVL